MSKGRLKKKTTQGNEAGQNGALSASSPARISLPGLLTPKDFSRHTACQASSSPCQPAHALQWGPKEGTHSFAKLIETN